MIAAGLASLHATRLRPTPAINAALEQLGQAPLVGPATAFELLKRPRMTYGEVAGLVSLPRFDVAVERQLEIEASYDGYVRRQHDEVLRLQGMEAARIPETISYADVEGLSSEATEKLQRLAPRSLGQAARISGITPAALSALAIHLKRRSPAF
jgi:tRNA uridine 5-carboxymethylaminomethyl modification enzyme